MPLDIPNLDTLRWADLIEEARALIPTAAPAWTDHNIHDPGITFIELFAWLAEMQLYQINRVSQRHRLAFARLAGVERCLRRPARVDLRFDGPLPDSVVMPAGTAVRPLDGTDLVFETETAVQLTRSRLQRVTVDDGHAPIDQTQANSTPGVAFLAFGDRAETGASLGLGFDAFHPDEEPGIRIAFDVFDDDLKTSCEGDAIGSSSCDATVDVSAAPVGLVWEYLAADSRWMPLTPVGDGTSALLRSGVVALRTPGDAVRQGRQVWIRARVASGAYDIEPRLRRISLNVLPCVQQQSIGDEILCEAATGLPDQAYQLKERPVLIPPGTASDGAPVAIRVGGEEWTPVASFDESGPGSKAFVFDSEAGRVLFGNGLNGLIPASAQRIVARYRTCAGSKGNVASGLRWAFVSGGVSGVTLMNPAAARGGRDPETAGDLELRAQALLRHPQRGVTLTDLEALARATPDARVARAKAIANCPTPESITVVAVPKVRPGRGGPPRKPSEAFLAAVRRYLQRRRLLCDDIRVVGPMFVEVRVSARLRLVKGASATAVIERARLALDAFLAGERAADGAPAAGPLNPCPTRWPFGRSVFPSEVFAAIDEVEGVDFASGVLLSAEANGTAIGRDASGAIPVPAAGLVYGGPHDLAVDAGSPRRTR